MNVTAVCVTWNRPEMLGRLIHCFHQQQDVPNSSLLILDDAGQYPCINSGRGWVLLSTGIRYPTLGEKRNAAVEFAAALFPQTEAIAVWDDDDVYWPHTLRSVASALAEAAWAQPRIVFESSRRGWLNPTKTYIDESPEPVCYGGAWAFRLAAFNDVGGYPPLNNSEDCDIGSRFLRQHGPSGDSSAPCDPWYWYNRRPGQIAELGEEVYAIRGRETVEWCDYPPIGWNGPNVYEFPQTKRVHPRPF